MPAKLLDILHPDECCNKRLAKALAAGGVPTGVWVCPKCSVEWRAELKQTEDDVPYRKWDPHCPTAVFRL